MNMEERRAIERIEDAFRAVPLPINGANMSQSASTIGFVSYGLDMAHLKPLLQVALLGIKVRGIPGWEDAVQDGEDAMREVEEYIAKRQAEDWQLGER